ncbi:hypothetical protein [Streptacidiphilus neutrinimicus]|uniref:hypothetical protein n=1 Tax=Streptacidiphilus neutrinimicus TaxID=105420 RepID=UPI000693E21E|nr:hypothetical protein [Streptacidiphilus neutrinimicus]
METLTDRDFCPEWHDALALLSRDLAATEPEAEPFAPLLDAYGVFVGFRSWGAQGSPLREEAGLPEVADAAQESAVEHLWRTWPVCPEHGLGLHPRLREEDGAKVWWCGGRGPASGHGTPVGTLEARRTISRRASRRGRKRWLGLR